MNVIVWRLSDQQNIIVYFGTDALMLPKVVNLVILEENWPVLFYQR